MKNYSKNNSTSLTAISFMLVVLLGHFGLLTPWFWFMFILVMVVSVVLDIVLN